MDHRRKQIRDAVLAKVTGLATTAGRVFAGRTLPLTDAYDPTLLIYARTERARFGAMGGSGRLMERQVRVAVHGKVALAATDPEDTLDQIALEVERAMMADETLGGLVVSLVLSETELDAAGPDDGSNRRRGDIRLTYDIEYSSAADDPARSV